MCLVRPQYYDRFHCKASACRHSCCVGWEIDVDPDTLEKYGRFDGKLAEKLKKSIVCDENGCASILLTDDVRCPFLDADGLCEIIKETDESYLCDICAEHPRFYNEFDTRTEVGLGLCCEEAAELILGEKESFSLVGLENVAGTDEERAFFDFRTSLIKILEDDTLTFPQRADAVLKKADAKLPFTDTVRWAEVYEKLEKLSDERDTCIDALKRTSELSFAYDGELPARLAVYFIYRHLAQGLYDGRIRERTAFAFLSTAVILTVAEGMDFNGVCNVARIYSSEIEYSNENIEILLEILK